jgi:hypothetical protein
MPVIVTSVRAGGRSNPISIRESAPRPPRACRIAPYGPRAVTGRSGRETADLASGRQAMVHLAGDVVLAATGIELDSLDTPRRLSHGS